MTSNRRLHEAAKASARKGININPHHQSLHSVLGISESKPIPMSEKLKAAHSSNPTIRKKGQFAVNASKWGH